MGLVQEYITFVTAVRRYSPRTADIYSRALEEFSEYSKAASDEKLLEALCPSVIRSYEVYLLNGKKDSSRTVNLHLSVISGFCRFLMKNGRLKSNPVKAVSRPKTEKRLPVFYKEESMEDYFTLTECEALEENLDLLTPGDKISEAVLERRLNRLIISMLYNTGLRRSELISLKISDVDFSRHVIRVKGKGGKMREIPLLETICEEISLYLKAVETMEGRERKASEPLLVTKTGSSLYPVFIDRAVKSELGKVQSITGRKSPHVLRHSLATGLLNEGADLNSIKELLGHSSLAATQVYTHNSIAKLKQVYANAHPRAKNGGKNGD